MIQSVSIIDYIPVTNYVYIFIVSFFLLSVGTTSVDSFVAALLSLLKSLLDMVIFFHLTCPDRKKASTSLYVFQVLERKRRFV